MEYSFLESDAIPDSNWKPLFDPVEFEVKNKPMTLQKHALGKQQMLVQGKLVTQVREKILSKAH